MGLGIGHRQIGAAAFLSTLHCSLTVRVIGRSSTTAADDDVSLCGLAQWHHHCCPSSCQLTLLMLLADVMSHMLLNKAALPLSSPYEEEYL
jgi:hypothetical protein